MVRARVASERGRRWRGTARAGGALARGGGEGSAFGTGTGLWARAGRVMLSGWALQRSIRRFPYGNKGDTPRLVFFFFFKINIL